MPLYLCVDCGGSKAAAVIADETGSPVARAFGGPSNFAYLGLQPFISVVKETVEETLRNLDTGVLQANGIDTAGPLTLPPPSGKRYLTAAWFGVSGCDSPQAIAEMTPPLEALLGICPRVANDTHLLAAPMTLYPDVTGAIGLVAGTGGIVVSFCEAIAKTASGDELAGLEELGRCGGWGWILGDEGGGFHVGREAIRQVLDEADRATVKPKTISLSRSPGKPWGLRQRILARFAVQDAYELLTIVHKPDPAPISPTISMSSDASLSLRPTPPTFDSTMSRDNLLPMAAMPREKRLSSLSPLVFAAAFEDGDPLALNVLKTTSGALVDQICVLLRTDDVIPEEQAGTKVAGEVDRRIKAEDSILCMGGSLSGIEAYRKLIVGELASRGHVFRRLQIVDDAAVIGAQALSVMKT